MQLSPITNEELLDHLTTIATDGVDIFLLEEGTIRLVVIHGTTLVNQMAANHELSGTGARLLGEAYLLTALAGSTLKNEENLGLLLESSGSVRGVSVDVNGGGQIRGYLLSPVTDGDAMGEGTLEIVRTSADHPRPVRGQIAFPEGTSVSGALEYYFQLSEQTPTGITVQIYTTTQGDIFGAAALLVQAMPGADLDRFTVIREIALGISGLGHAFAVGTTAAEVVRTLFTDSEPELIATRRAEFYCSCSRERFQSFLCALPEEERQDILENGPFPLITTCHNCSSDYLFTRDELRQMFESSS